MVELVQAADRSDLPSVDEADAQKRESLVRLAKAGEAGKLLERGEFDAAIAASQALLDLFPDSVTGYYFVGLAEANKGNLEAAEDAFGKAVALRPAYVPYRLGRAEILSKLGRLAEAKTEYERALEMEPHSQQTIVLLSQVEKALGNTERAGVLIKQATASGIGPLAALKRKKRLRELSEEARKLGMPPGTADHYANANLLVQEGRHEDAYGAYKKAIQAGSDHPAALLSAARMDLDRGRAAEAVKLLTSARERMPHEARIAILLAEAACRNLEFDTAAAVIDSLDESAKEEAGYWTSYCIFLTETSKPQPAVEAGEKAIQLGPEDPNAAIAYGRALAVAGRLDEAANWAVKIVQRHPLHIPGYSFLALLGKLEYGGMHFTRLQDLVYEPSQVRRHRSIGHFTLGQACAKAKNYNEAFEHYALGNRLVDVVYNAEWEARKAQDIIAGYSREAFARFEGVGLDDTRPVLVVGMPRSGTTLVEQIIASHPLAFGVGESLELVRHDSNLGATEAGKNYRTAEKLQALDPETVREIAVQYLSEVTENAPASAMRIVDKMPHNFLRLGLFAILFPKARVIYCKRNPLDNCLSILFTHFTGTHRYAYEMANLGHEYRLHEQLLEHWKSVLPIPIHQIVYENLINHPEFEIKKLIDFCGLEWDDRCLEFHKTERSVQSASLGQVRQKLYASAIGRWKPYEEHLGPLKKALGIED